MFEPQGFSLEIFKQRYAFTEAETWKEGCERVARQMSLAETPEKQKLYNDKFNSLLVDNLFAPGGRIWYNSGRNNPQLLNCVSGDTLIHVRGGKRPAKDLVGQEIETLSWDGLYRKASWSCYGEQPLLKVTLENGDELFATAGHEWLVTTPKNKRNRVVTTTNLVGHKIPLQHAISIIVDPIEFHIGVKHGMVYGDGSIHKSEFRPGPYAEIRQFGEVNTAMLLEWFKDENLYTYQCKKYGTVHYASHLPVEWKALPASTNSQSYLRGFVAGLIGTDGHFGKRGDGGIYQANLAALQEIRELASIAGFPTNGISLYRKFSPFDGSEKPCYKLSFYRNSIADDLGMLIKSTHKSNMLHLPQFKNRRRLERVVSVEKTGRVESVYCCVEPETHTMVIGNGYLTKQCFVLDSNKDSKEGWGKSAYNMIVTSMTGGGCGDDFSDVRPRGAQITSHRGECPGPVELMRLLDGCAKPVKAGGGRRVALMFSLDLDHPDIEEFLNAKLIKGELVHANVSVRSKRTTEFIKAVEKDQEWELSWKGKYKKIVKAKQIWDLIVSNAYNSGEPGFLNWELVEQESNIWYINPLISTNPCFSADTVIAVADGRNAVSIKQLADEGKDVPVYSLDKKTGKVSIKLGRHPRVTGHNKKLVRVWLDDGSYLDTTPDHKFIFLSGNSIEAKDLKPGDSLPRFTKTLEPVKTGGKDYYRIYTNTLDSTKYKVFEHRLISKFYFSDKWEEVYQCAKQNGFAKTGGLVVHHKDFNSLNNSPDNLEIMTFREHSKLHGVLGQSGDKNGNYSGASSEQIKEHALILAELLGRKFSFDEWVNYASCNELPENFGVLRKNQFGSVPQLAKWAAASLGYSYIDKNPMLLQTHKSMLEQGYKSRIEKNKVLVSKTCERCGQEFEIQHLFRETSFCSMQCGNLYVNSNVEFILKRTEAMNKSYSSKMLDVKIEQSKTYSNLKFNLKRNPFKNEWVQECKNNNISSRLDKNSKFGFKNFKEVKTSGDLYNHKVVKVEELAGEHDVYNITVDDNHSVAIITKTNNKRGRNWYSGIFVSQCGELPLSEYESCCLGHLVLPRFIKNGEIDYEQLRDAIRMSVRFLDNVLSVNHYPLPEMHKVSQNLRRIGLGTTGDADMLAILGFKYGSEEGNKFFDKLFRFISKNAYEASILLAVEKGAFPLCNPEKHIQSGYVKRLPPKIRSLIAEHGIRNCTLLTQAPVGTVSILSGNCSAGIEPMFAPAYERRYWDKDVRKTELVFHPLFDQFMSEGKDVSHFVGSHDLTVKEHLEVQKTVQRHIDSACSKTINIPEKYPMEDVSKLWLEYLPHIKGVTFYRENTRGFVKEDGTIEEPPLKPLTLEQAKKKFKKEHVVDSTPAVNCPSGVCDL